jgi:predicted O-methyltransferase YrrM
VSAIRDAGGRTKLKLKRIANAPRRSRRFTNRDHDRFWWHRIEQNDYVPSLYRALSAREWAIIAAWYDDTAWYGRIGEINVPAMSFMQGLITGNGIRRTVELGSYHGYSTLLTGFMLRSMRNDAHMVSIDLDPIAVEFTQKWLDKAGLNDQVTMYLGDASAQSSLDFAVDKLGGMPELILLDSSHQYSITLQELDLWVPRMEPGTIMLLHDTSTFARDFDPTDEGGVQRALDEWLPNHPEVAFLNLNRQVEPGTDGSKLVYKDGCGLGILQKLAV